jgi:hypothetical protein
MARPAHPVREIIQISNVFGDASQLLICGLTVRFRPGSPTKQRTYVAASRLIFGATAATPAQPAELFRKFLEWNRSTRRETICGLMAIGEDAVAADLASDPVDQIGRRRVI